MPIIMLYVDNKNLNRILDIIRLLQPLYLGDLVVDNEDKNIFELITDSNKPFFKVKQEQ